MIRRLVDTSDAESSSHPPCEMEPMPGSASKRTQSTQEQSNKRQTTGECPVFACREGRLGVGSADSSWRDCSRQLSRDGVCALKGVVSSTWAANALSFVHSLSPCVRYGGLRVELSLSRKEGAFSASTLLEHTRLRALLEQALGKEFRLLRVGGVMSFPGADDQPVHRDGAPLFTASELASYEPTKGEGSCLRVQRALPPHALHLWLPIDSNYRPESGATSFYLGTHMSSVETFAELPAHALIKSQPIISLGDALLFDDRIFHYGGANLSDTTRTCIFYSFARPFYSDSTREEDRDKTAWTEIE